MKGFPKPLTYLGLPLNLSKIDAALVWGHNQKTYLFAGNQYWRLEETSQKVEVDYPRNMNVWRGIPANLNSAFTWHKNGISYFFKDSLFYDFNNRWMKVIKAPRKSIEFWFDFHCLAPNSVDLLNKRKKILISDQDSSLEEDYYFVYDKSNQRNQLDFILSFISILILLVKNFRIVS